VSYFGNMTLRYPSKLWAHAYRRAVNLYQTMHLAAQGSGPAAENDQRVAYDQHTELVRMLVLAMPGPSPEANETELRRMVLADAYAALVADHHAVTTEKDALNEALFNGSYPANQYAADEHWIEGDQDTPQTLHQYAMGMSGARMVKVAECIRLVFATAPAIGVAPGLYGYAPVPFRRQLEHGNVDQDADADKVAPVEAPGDWFFHQDAVAPELVAAAPALNRALVAAWNDLTAPERRIVLTRWDQLRMRTYTELQILYADVRDIPALPLVAGGWCAPTTEEAGLPDDEDEPCMASALVPCPPLEDMTITMTTPCCPQFDQHDPLDHAPAAMQGPAIVLSDAQGAAMLRLYEEATGMFTELEDDAGTPNA